MKHLFDAARVEEVQARMAQLRPESTALWGTMNPAQAHSFFGRLTPEEWATLMYKHLDHHLRQFGA
jgi:hypothetical protein